MADTETSDPAISSEGLPHVARSRMRVRTVKAAHRPKYATAAVSLTPAELKTNAENLARSGDASTPIRARLIERVAARYVSLAERKAELQRATQSAGGRKVPDPGTTPKHMASYLVEQALIVDPDDADLTPKFLHAVAVGVWGPAIGSEVARMLDGNWAAARARGMIDIWRVDDAMDWPSPSERLIETAQESESDPAEFYEAHKLKIDAAVEFYRECALAEGAVASWGERLKARRAENRQARRAAKQAAESLKHCSDGEEDSQAYVGHPGRGCDLDPGDE